MERRAPTRDETLTALAAFRWGFFGGSITGFEARADDFLVLIRHSRTEGDLAVAYRWPDPDLTGESTGEPQSSLHDWVSEIELDLDEFFATEPLQHLRGEPDPETGRSVIRRY